ncbi:hypothetical protein ACQP2Y_01090 [Actinoplanes sp. CA-051413]|uniref:hypothetical protein n=1 Tax=Actinoplanes sp. CA-051413 TaxID=3239899 RepID=UPI003D98A433
MRSSLAAFAACLLMAPTAANARPPSPSTHECATPSIDRLQQWLASGEGTTIPATGSLLVPTRTGYKAEVTFLNAEWHVVVVWLANQFEAQVDLSSSRGFWLTYSATDDLYVQLRPASHWSGGAQWATAIPSTHGRTVTRFFSFRPEAWTAVPELGAPAHSFADAISEARGLVFVGKTPNELTFRGMRFHRYTPPCL